DDGPSPHSRQGPNPSRTFESIRDRRRNAKTARWPTPDARECPSWTEGDGSGAPRPGPEPVDLPRRDDPLLRDPEPFGALGAVGLHLQLPGGVGVGVDREEAAGLQGQLDEVVGWVAPLGAGVDVRGHVVLGA